jgi:hypothetical protein
MSKYKTPEYREKHAKYARNRRAAKPGEAEARNRRWAEKHPERYQFLQKNGSLKKLYGITLEERDLILKSQGDRCAICRTDNPGRRGWFVDHCHVTNRVRGIVCPPCNSVLGYAKDDPAILRAAAAYLKRGLLLQPGHKP